ACAARVGCACASGGWWRCARRRSGTHRHAGVVAGAVLGSARQPVPRDGLVRARRALLACGAGSLQFPPAAPLLLLRVGLALGMRIRRYPSCCKLPLRTNTWLL